jgi:hypothetical protein
MNAPIVTSSALSMRALVVGEPVRGAVELVANLDHITTTAVAGLMRWRWSAGEWSRAPSLMSWIAMIIHRCGRAGEARGSEPDDGASIQKASFAISFGAYVLWQYHAKTP